MFQVTQKNRIFSSIKESSQSNPEKKNSKFHTLYSEVFRQVKKKIPTQMQNFPLIKMKSYQIPTNGYLEVKNQPTLSQHKNSVNIFTSKPHSSVNFLNSKRTHSCLNKNPVNKVLWQKKMSLETLRISSSSNKLKSSKISRQMQRQSLKTLRRKTKQDKFLNQDQDIIGSTHFSIVPLNIISSKEDKQKFIANKKKIQEKFKITFFNEKDKKANKINFLAKKDKNQIWEIQREDDQFVNFVRDKISSNF